MRALGFVPHDPQQFSVSCLQSIYLLEEAVFLFAFVSPKIIPNVFCFITIREKCRKKSVHLVLRVNSGQWTMVRKAHFSDHFHCAPGADNSPTKAGTRR